jgi:hypothetical protein
LALTSKIVIAAKDDQLAGSDPEIEFEEASKREICVKEERLSLSVPFRP